MQKKISLIIPAKTNEFYIEDVLINILQWSLSPLEVIIVVTSHKKIKIDKYLARDFKKKNINLILIYKKNFFPGAARNVGILKAKYDYLVFLDMNTLPYSKDWLKINFKYILKNKLKGVTGQTFYLASNKTEKIIRAATYGKASLSTIPGSIFLKKSVYKVGFFDPITRAGEDTDWIKRLNSNNLNIKNAIHPVFYKGLYNTNYIIILKKWFRNYYDSSHLPHMSLQRFFYITMLFIVFFFFAYNLNHLILQWQSPDELYFPHITKIFLFGSIVVYTFIRGVLMPLQKKIDLKYLFPYNFFFVTVFSISLDIVKMLTFFSALLRKGLNKNTQKLMK